jgi:hypothetical protein
MDLTRSVSFRAAQQTGNQNPLKWGLTTKYCEAVIVLPAAAAEDSGAGLLFQKRNRIVPIQGMQKEYNHEVEHLSL